MPDEIIGLAVLQKTWVPGVYTLWVDGRKSNGNIVQLDIFIKDEKNTTAPDKMPGYEDGINSIWKFRREGNILHCHPSVNAIYCGFHNPAQWQIPFVEMVAEQKSCFSPDYVEPKRNECGHSIHYDINRLRKTDEERLAFVRELAEEGVVRL